MTWRLMYKAGIVLVSTVDVMSANVAPKEAKERWQSVRI